MRHIYGTNTFIPNTVYFIIGKNICWKYITALHDQQTKEGLRAGNKLKTAHVNFHKQKMKVFTQFINLIK